MSLKTNLLVKILKEKKIMYGLQKHFLLPFINRTRAKNDFNVKVTSLQVHPSQAKNYKNTKLSPQKKDPFDQIKTAVAKAVFNGERFVLNAKNVLSDLLLEDVDILKNGKLSFLQWIKNEKEIAGANIGNIIRNKNLAEMMQRMRDLNLGKKVVNVGSALKGLISTDELERLRWKVRAVASNIKLPSLPSLPSPPSLPSLPSLPSPPSLPSLVNKPIPVSNVYPIDQSNPPLSVKEQIILQYMFVILGGAFILAI